MIAPRGVALLSVCGCPVRPQKEGDPVGLARSFLTCLDCWRVVTRWLSLKLSRHEKKPHQGSPARPSWETSLKLRLRCQREGI
jgi:hypothetical protein